MLLAGTSLYDERPAKRRRIDAPKRPSDNKLAVADALHHLRNLEGPHLFYCGICHQSVGARSAPPLTCPQCQNICCSRCTSQCNAAFPVNLPPTPPLCDDSASPSLPSTPTRYPTPEPFNPDLLRARLVAAAAALETPSTSGNNNTNRATNQIMKKRRRSSNISEAQQKRFLGPSAQQRHRGTCFAFQPASTSYGPGCSTRLCLNCLVETGDGHKTCFSCLDDSLA